MMWIALFAQDPNAVGITGWVAAVSSVGLLGPVLYWLTMIHLPAKDKQMRELLDLAGQDRERDRVSRHDMASSFQTLLARMQEQHDADLDKHQHQTESMLQAVKQEAKESKEEFKAALAQVIAHCDRETSKLVEAFRIEMGRLVPNDRKPRERAP